MFADYQSLYSEMKFSRMYLFKGAPDLIATVRKPPIVKTDVLIMSLKSESNCNSESLTTDFYEDGYWDDNLDSEYSSTVEIAMAPAPVSAVTRIPEKLGQLIAGLYLQR